MSFEFAQSFCFQYRASRYITGLNRTSELIVIVVCNCYEVLISISSISIYYVFHLDIRVKSYCRLNLLKLLFSISSVSVYYETQSDIGVKSYCGLHLLRASVFNYGLLDILWDSIEKLSKNLLPFEFPTSFRFQLRASRYIIGLNRTSELKFIVF